MPPSIRGCQPKVPIVTWLPKYTLRVFVRDLLAGFTVALTEIPQSIAYAGIANLPLQYGLYSSFMGGFVYVILGSCDVINMGATSLMALMIQRQVATLGAGMAVFMTFVSGVLILVAGLLHLGFVIDFFSYPVTAGFTSAAALTIASLQLNNLFGIATDKSPDDFLEAWRGLSHHAISQWDTVLGLVTLALLVTLKELGRCRSANNKFVSGVVFAVSVARNAIVVVIGMGLAYWLGQDVFRLTGDVADGFPNVSPPPFSINWNGTLYSFSDLVNEYGAGLGLVPLVAILETVAIGKVFSKGKAVDASQEMVALGVANIASSFFQSMPVTGSFSRTAVNHNSGAKTNMSGVVTGVVILIALAFLTDTFAYIPKATLAAVIICAMAYIFEYEAFVTLWKTNKLDFFPFLVTLFSCIFVSLEYGMLIGIAANLVPVLYAVTRPKFRKEKNVVTPQTTVHFPAAEHLRSFVLDCDEPLVVLDGRHLGNVDVTVAKTISCVLDQMDERGQKVVFVNFKQKVQNVLVALNKNALNRFTTTMTIEGCES